MRPIFLVLIAAAASAQAPRIGTIDFYGYSGLDPSRLKMLLPFHEGDPLPSKRALAEARPGYAKAVGRERVEMQTVCCLPDGRWSLDELDRQLPSLLLTPPRIEDFLEP